MNTQTKSSPWVTGVVKLDLIVVCLWRDGRCFPSSSVVKSAASERISRVSSLARSRRTRSNDDLGRTPFKSMVSRREVDDEICRVWKVFQNLGILRSKMNFSKTSKMSSYLSKSRLLDRVRILNWAELTGDVFNLFQSIVKSVVELFLLWARAGRGNSTHLEWLIKFLIDLRGKVVYHCQLIKKLSSIFFPI